VAVTNAEGNVIDSGADTEKKTKDATFGQDEGTEAETSAG